MDNDFVKLCGRISHLADECPELTHTLRFLTAAVLSLKTSQSIGHKTRSSFTENDRQYHLDELLNVCKDLAPTSQWEAGFHYNAAIMRIHACYERLMKAVIKTGKIKSLNKQTNDLSKTEQLAMQIENNLNIKLKREHLESVRKEVNKLKHSLFGQNIIDAVVDDLSNACAAINELLDIMEDSSITTILISRYKALPSP